MIRFIALLAFPVAILGSFILHDPSDDLPSLEWTADNNYSFDWHSSGVTYQAIAVTGPYYYIHEKGNLEHEVLENHTNDTSVLVVTEGSTVSVEHSKIVKSGYSSSLTQASFYGVNVAINNANGSLMLRISGSIALDLSLMAFYAKNVQHYSGGERSSSFSGDVPNGFVHVDNAVAHTDGVGSAVCFLQGVCNMTNVLAYARKAPVMFSDGSLGPVTGIWKNSDLTAGLLAGMMLFSDSTISDGSTTVIENTKLTVLGDTMPALWAGNIIADAYIRSSSINNTASGLLVVANYSYVTQDFDYYAGYDDNNDLSPGQINVYVENSDLVGSLVAYNKSLINFNLAQFSNWSGDAKIGFGDAHLAVHLDDTSTWNLTGNSVVQNFSDTDTSLRNIVSNGFSITYDKTSQANAALKGKTYKLSGGGSLRPE